MSRSSRGHVFVSLCLTLSVVILVAVSTTGAQAKRMPKHVKKRTVSAGYNYVASSSEQPLQYNVAEPVEVEVGKKEGWAAITIEDKTRRPVGVIVSQDADGDGSADSEWEVCGETTSALRIAPNKPLTVLPVTGSCSNELATATTGTIHVDLYSPAPKPPASVTKFERVVAFSYTGWWYEGGGQFAVGSYTINTSPSETYISIASSDLTGLPVNVQVYPEQGRTFSVCGATEEPIQIEPGSRIQVSVWAEPCADGTPSAMTAGEIEVTLANSP